jgi:hypothetical protein
MKHFAATIAFASLIASGSPSFAGAVLEQSSGPVLADSGRGFSKVSVGAHLSDGTRILVRSKKGGDVVLRFDDGCSLPLGAGQVFTIAAQSPCTLKAQAPSYRGPEVPYEVGGGFSPPFVFGGLIVAGGLFAGIYGVSQDHSVMRSIPLFVSH